MMKHWRLIYLTIPLTVAVFAAILLANEWKNARPAQGIGRVPEAVRYAAEAEAVEEETEEYRLVSYTEGDGPAPEWWMPDEPMAAEWEESYGQVTENNEEAVSGDFGVFCGEAEQVRKDAGCPDWNVDTTVYGWDGHTAEPWELDLMARVFYLEFWGVSDPCAEAGCDAILNLWDTGKYGRTLFDALSYYDPDYGYTYRVYPRVWTTDYNADGLAWCKEFCIERFLNGPEWECVYFQLGGYHDTDWVPPLYEMDGVYFSGKGWN